MVKLPKTLKIGGLHYSVQRPDLIYEEGNTNLGEQQLLGLLIRINRKLPDDQQFSTLLHEILEAINQMFALELEHKQIDTLEAALFQVLEDNFPNWVVLQ